MKILEVNNLKVNYGPVIGVKKVDLYVDQGETVALLGANGAGKTSTISSIAGISNKAEGEVIFRIKYFQIGTRKNTISRPCYCS